LVVIISSLVKQPLATLSAGKQSIKSLKENDKSVTVESIYDPDMSVTYFKMKMRKCFSVTAKMPASSLTEIGTIFQTTELTLYMCRFLTPDLYFCIYFLFLDAASGLLPLFLCFYLHFRQAAPDIHPLYSAICNRSALVNFNTFIKDYM
jgi:hypothetical protein